MGGPEQVAIVNDKKCGDKKLQKKCTWQLTDSVSSNDRILGKNIEDHLGDD